MEDHQNESTSKAAKFEELLKKTVAQLKVIVMNFEESHDKRFKIPTRKNEIIQLIIDNDMYKSNDHDFEKRTKPSTKRSLIDNESDNNNNNNNDEEQLLYNNDDDDDEKEEGEDEEVEQDEDEDDSMMEGEGEEQQKQQQRKQHNKQTTTTTTTTSNINIKSIVVSNNNNNKGQPVDLLKENADAWFNKVQSDVVTKKKLIRSFDDFDQRAENTTTIDDMFRYYFREKTSLDIFTTTNFPIHGTTRCSNYLFRRWHFICLTCSTVDIKYCVDCFLNGIHREENHRFSLVYTPNISCVCDCGDGDVMKTSSFCTKHRFATNIQQKENYINQFPEYLRDAFKTFFNKLVTRALTLNRQGSGVHELEIINITTYLGKAASRSPLYAKLIGEELTLMNLDLSNFDISNPLRIASNNALAVGAAQQQQLQQNNKRQKTIPNSTPLYTLFHTHLDFSTKYFYLFATVSYHNLPFGQVFFHHYLANFSHLMRPQPRIAIAESCYHLQQFYKSPSSILIPFATGKVNSNLFLVLFQHYKYNMDTIHNSFVLNKSTYESYRFESKMFSRLLKIEECAVYFSNNQMILKIFLDICQNLHLFASVAFKFENILRELKDLIHLESCLINGFNHMLQHLPEAKIQEMTKTIIDQAMDLSTKIKYPVYARDKGTRLLFPLPRIIALCVLHSSANNNIDHFIQLVKSDYEHYSPSIADMVFNITTFRAFYYAHCCRPRNQNLDSHVVASPTDDDRFNRFFTQKFMMLDFLMLQLSLISTGPSTFLYQLLNEPFSYSATNNEWLKVIFEIIVNVLQTRATIKPTEEDIEYHYIQAAASGYFYYSEMLNFKFIYKNIPMETKERIIAKVVKDVKAPKMQLKPEYWSRYDPYYWSFEYVFKIHLQELAKEEFTKYQRENNIPECFPSLPALLPPLDNKLDGIYQLFHENALYEFLHYTTMKIVYPNFKGFKDFEKNTNSFYANHNLFGKISTSDIIVINDIYYILLMALRHFDQWIVEQSDRDVRAIRHEVSQFLSNNNYKKHPQQRPLYFWETNNVVTMLLRAYTPSFKNIRKKQSQSFLDTLIYCWKINSTDQNPLLQEIMIWFGQFDDSINDYFETQGITDFDPKKREEEEREKRRKIMQAKRDEIMKQMKEKQNQFLQLTENQDLYDETEVLENNTTTSTTTTNNNNNNNNTSEDSSNNTSTTATATATTTSGEQHHHDESTDKICMICRDTTSTEPLYTVARVTNCTLAMNQKSTSLYKLIRSMPQSYLNTTIQNLLEHQENIFFDSKRFPKSVTQLYPLMIEFFKSYYHLPSYISSCLHYTHRSCIDQSVHNFDFGFQCPQCNANSNILIPVDVANLTIEEVMKFFLNIQDAGEIDEVFERHFWGMVHSNIDVFEMKTRQISNYIVDTDQLPYYLLTDLEFKQELATLRILFKTITSCEVPPFAEDLIDVDDHLKFHVDPFFLSTYLVYLRKLDYKTTNSQSIKQYLFNYILMEAMKLPKFKVTQSADTIRQIYANLKDNQESLNSYLFPVLRKCYLYHCLASYPTQPALINQLSQQQFASFEYIKTSLNIGNTTEIISQTELEDFINRFSNLKKGFVSFIPSSYLHLPKLKKLQPKYIDFIIKNIPNTVQEEQQFMCTSCEKTQSFKCLSCGSTTCAPDCIHSFVSHPKQCPNGLHQVFLFIDITTGLLKVVDLDKDVILYNNDSLCVYFNEHNEPSTITNNQLTLSNKHLQSVYKKWVQMISTNTIQSMDIDLPNTLFPCFVDHIYILENYTVSI